LGALGTNNISSSIEKKNCTREVSPVIRILDCGGNHTQRPTGGRQMTPASRLSGLQRDVLALYRSILREAVRKDRRGGLSSLPPSTAGNNAVGSHPQVGEMLSSSGGGERRGTTAFARDRFRREASEVRRSDFKTIEYKIRKGRKQLELLRMPGVDLVGGA
jgi:hypothetical protein